MIKPESNLTIVIPVNEKEEIVEQFIGFNKEYLKNYRVIVINKSGGEALREYADVYIQSSDPLHKARRAGIDLVLTPFALMLDADVILPVFYIKWALVIFANSKDTGAVSIDYHRLQGHLAFGQSVWDTEVLKSLYDWRIVKETKICECVWMWGKLNRKTKLNLRTMTLTAGHLKEVD